MVEILNGKGGKRKSPPAKWKGNDSIVSARWIGRIDPAQRQQERIDRNRVGRERKDAAVSSSVRIDVQGDGIMQRRTVFPERP